ncbi:unnamed protein product [Rotaria socialis]|uniref:DED domain-containing protein n=2 Tax=Rotaria socialis TaxID=392032 RepID=A0A820PH27_9BILA|nr:unnamed protein product [Rotaria socialis]CAF3353604.1 unnamed protein product [Rotaria socialis]CAF4403239.1 unnamed protein product [Rotaria socialis]CAF4419571.1 unnamed protein product [Rotaria socialis]CAF4740332.1 unnamed protein product [Rotaria socialis]
MTVFMYETDNMDMKFRQFLLAILDDLSDLDRCRLHFVLGKQIPRRLRESYNIENTIQIFEHLIDTGNVFPYLVDALSACGRLDWSEKLKEYKSMSCIEITHPNQQSTTEISLTQKALEEMTDDEEDSGTTFLKFFTKNRALFNSSRSITLYFDANVQKKGN